MNLTELEKLIEQGPDAMGVVNFALLKVLAFMMREAPEDYPSTREAVLSRLESEAEIYVTMGMLGHETDREHFKAWAKLACQLGVSLEEATVVTDRGADRGMEGFKRESGGA